MGDLLNNSEMLEKLGVDSSNQWIIYDKQFEKFFNFLSENVNDSNIFTTKEFLEHHEMILQRECLNESKRVFKMPHKESENPDLLTLTKKHLKAFAAHLLILRNTSTTYSVLLKEMQNSKQSLNYCLSLLESTAVPLQNLKREIQTECQKRSHQVEEVQCENCKLSDASKKDLTTQQISPCFMHQLQLAQYFIKCDSFMQNFILYMKENFKIRSNEELDESSLDNHYINSLEYLPTTIQHYKLFLIKEKTKANATKALIDLVVNQIRCIKLADMKRESHELQSFNDNYLKNSYDTLLNALSIHIHEHIQQSIEMVLFENTKQKLERACCRRENDKQLSNVISDALTNAEIIWIGIQLDLEKKRKNTDSFIRICKEVSESWRRVKEMRPLYASYKSTCNLLHKMEAELFTQLSKYECSAKAKNCLYIHDKFGKFVVIALQNMLKNKFHTYLKESLDEFLMVEQTLNPFIYDSPLDLPMFENVQYLCSIFTLAKQQQHFTNQLGHLRSTFLELVLERMNNEKLWSYSILLWTWFLTDPQCLFNAVGEAKRLSAVPALTSNVLRPGSGLQRK